MRKIAFSGMELRPCRRRDHVQAEEDEAYFVLDGNQLIRDGKQVDDVAKEEHLGQAERGYEAREAERGERDVVARQTLHPEQRAELPRRGSIHRALDERQVGSSSAQRHPRGRACESNPRTRTIGTSSRKMNKKGIKMYMVAPCSSARANNPLQTDLRGGPMGSKGVHRLSCRSTRTCGMAPRGEMAVRMWHVACEMV